jgi:DNA-binding transcriptional MocR family regulator
MFAWFQPDMGAMRFHEALKAAKILAVSGSACGVDDSWFRMSLGHLSEVLEPQLRKLADILKEMKP